MPVAVDVEVAASILTADFGHLYRVVRKLERAGVDRLHLDVMDGHFVPNITFGPDVVAAFRRLSKLPLDVHLMISEPSRYVSRFLDAGGGHDHLPRRGRGDATRIKRETLERIRAAGRQPGLAVSPETPIDAVRPFLDDLDIVMVMTVQPGLRRPALHGRPGAQDRPRRARCSATGRARRSTSMAASARETAEIVGGYGVDVCVVGSALFQRGHDTARRGSRPSESALGSALRVRRLGRPRTRRAEAGCRMQAAAPAGHAAPRFASRAESSAPSGRGWSCWSASAIPTTRRCVETMAGKVVDLRIFRDEEGKTNRSLIDVGGEVLAISQFTLFADTRKGPAAVVPRCRAAGAGRAALREVRGRVEARGVKVARGIFGAEMEIELVNDGPMTIWLHLGGSGLGPLERAAAARADQHAARTGSGSLQPHELQVGLEAAMGADTVHAD